MVVGYRPFSRRDPAHSLVAAGPGCDAISDAAHDAGGRRRPKPAENDDVYAADLWFHVLLCVGWPCTILVNRQRSGCASAVDDQSLHAYAHAGSARCEGA